MSKLAPRIGKSWDLIVAYGIAAGLFFLVLWVLNGVVRGDWSPGFALGAVAVIVVLAGIGAAGALGWRRVVRPRRRD